jgi:hypothetical protein
MSKSSTKQFDAVWILNSADSDRCHLNTIFSNIEAFIGPGMRGMTTVIITKCDGMMQRGDYFQNPNRDPFTLPDEYEDEPDEEIREGLFWVKLMKKDQPFEFSNDKKLTSKPICWTNRPKALSKRLAMPVTTIEET